MNEKHLDQHWCTMNSAQFHMKSKRTRGEKCYAGCCTVAKVAEEGKVIAKERHALSTLSVLISQVIKDITKRCDKPVCLEPLDIFSHEWKYRGEGNANVVVALENEQRVIRLSKVNVGEEISDFTKHSKKVEREVLFANCIFGPLIGAEFVGLVKAVTLSQDHIARLNEMIHSTRPTHRRHKEIRVPYATSHGDFARIHSNPSSAVDVCVEIKPKQGWWPSSLRSCGGDLPNLCTYCLNQFLKLKRGKISSRTSYCPLDLFSGNAERMIEAVTALIANPQNNFRIFCDGKLVFGEMNDESLEACLTKWMGCSQNNPSFHDTESPGSLNSFVYLLCVALLSPKHIPDLSKCQQSIDTFNNITHKLRKILYHTPPSLLYEKISSKSPTTAIDENSSMFVDKNNYGKSCNDEAGQLPEECILSRILAVQKLAERNKAAFNDESSIYKIYQKICPVHSHNPKKDSRYRRWSPSRSPSSNWKPIKRDYDSESENAPKLNVVLTGDELDQFVDSGTETERMSDAESIEECFDVSSTEEEEEDTITGHLDDTLLANPCSTNFHQISFECPSSDCLSSEKWMDEIGNLSCLSDAELRATEMYLLAATAKDCSIMVTFSPINNNHAKNGSSLLEQVSNGIDRDSDLLIKDLKEKTHRVRIGVADMDPKPVTTIVRHYLRDNEMLQAYGAYCRD